jgi:hypothetical protein
MNEPWRAAPSRLQTIGFLKPEKVSRGSGINRQGRAEVSLNNCHCRLAGRPQRRANHGNTDEVISCWIIKLRGMTGGRQSEKCDATSPCSSVSANLCRRIYARLCTCRLRARIWRRRLWAQFQQSLGGTRPADAHLRKPNSGPAPATRAGAHHQRSGVATRAPGNVGADVARRSASAAG